MGIFRRTSLALLLAASTILGGLETTLRPQEVTNAISYNIPGKARIMGIPIQKEGSLIVTRGEENIESACLDIPSFNNVITYIASLINVKYFSRNIVYGFERKEDSLSYREIVYNNRAKEDTFKFRTKTVPWNQREEVLIYNIVQLITLRDLDDYANFKERNPDLFDQTRTSKRYIADKWETIWVEKECQTENQLMLDIRTPKITPKMAIILEFDIGEDSSFGLARARASYALSSFGARLQPN